MFTKYFLPFPSYFPPLWSWAWLCDLLRLIVCCCSASKSCLTVTPWTVACQFCSVSWSLLKCLSVESVMLSFSSSATPYSFCLQSFPAIRVFSSESALHTRCKKHWSFSFSLSPSNENSGLISFRIDWCDLFAVQGTVKGLLQHNSKASILWHSDFFMVEFSHPYITTGKTIALTIQIFVSKVMSLLFNTLCRFVVALLQRSKHIWISWLQSLSPVVLELKKMKCHCFYFFPCYLPWSNGTGCHGLRFFHVKFQASFFTFLCYPH